MSRYVTTIIIFILTITTIIGGVLFIINTTEKMYELTVEAEYFLENSEFEKAEDALFEAGEYLESHKKILMIIINHEYTESLETKLNKTRSFTKQHEKSFALAELSETKDVLKDMKNSQKMSIENIL